MGTPARARWERPAKGGTDAGLSFKPAQLAKRALHRRAVEAMIWGMPAVNYELMLQAMLDAGGAVNQIVYWSRPCSWKNQTLTPNPDTIYFMPFMSTKDIGPIVLEIPPADGGAIVGSLDDAWQTAIEDVGIAGVDRGAGGKYLILPPNYKGSIPGDYFVMPCATCQSFALLRSNYQSTSDADIAKAVQYGKRVKLYPLSRATNAPQTTFIDAIDVVFDARIPYDASYFDALNRIVQAEPWLTRDKAMIDTLKTIGIEKGMPFKPDAKTCRLLDEAALEAKAWLANRWDTTYFHRPYYNGGHWHVPGSGEVLEGLMTNFSKADAYPVDNRAVTYTVGFFSAKHLGTGQFYLMAIRDRDGKRLDGGNFYRLHVPPGAPAHQYWSATAYDGETHALIRDARCASRSSTTASLMTYRDGSIDLYFGPSAPNGRESNWIPTRPGQIFEVIFRLYGPEKPLFDKSWMLPDIERMK